MLDADRIAALLGPFVDASLPADLAARLQTYLELLLRWNARTNLSAVRDPEQIVRRHFGESLFAARILGDAGAFDTAGESPTLSDIGSGAGFPGIPIKLFAPKVPVTLIESQNKKATFLREVIRRLNLTDAEVFYGRAETWNRTASTVTLRAVERFDRVLPVAASLVAAAGTLCLLIGGGQVGSVQPNLNQDWSFQNPVFVPLSQGRVIYVGTRR
jgi:16S rRNA (guanine527-N7)-methyltransferase